MFKKEGLSSLLKSNKTDKNELEQFRSCESVFLVNSFKQEVKKLAKAEQFSQLSNWYEITEN